MKHRPPEIPRCSLPPVKPGTPVLILRPHLWSGAAGVVESYNEVTTLHRILIHGKDGANFHADCTAEVLKMDYGRMMGL